MNIMLVWYLTCKITKIICDRGLASSIPIGPETWGVLA